MNLETLKKIDGYHTVDSVSEKLGISRQSAINLISRLKKLGHVTTSGGGKRIRIYDITTTIQRPRDPGMFDILNKYARKKLNEWYDHQVHGKYTVEDAIVDAVTKRKFRPLISVIYCFNHVTDWPRLYRLANEKKVWQHVGALYDVARRFTRTRRMPKKYRKKRKFYWKTMINLKKKDYFPDIQQRWKVYIPFNRYDLVDFT